MGWTNTTIVSNLVIIEGPNDALFVYQGTPARGNLIASIAPAANTDLFSNSYFPVITVYSGNSPSSVYAQLNAGNIAFGVVSDGGGGSMGGLQIANSTLELFGNIGDALPVIMLSNLLMGQNSVVAGVPGSPTVAETWHAMTALPGGLKNGWVNRGGTFVTAQYQFLPLGTLGKTEIIGDISSGTITNGTVIATLPLAYAPSRVQQIGIQAALGTTAHSALDPVIEAETNGDLKIFNLGSGTTSISFNGSFDLAA